MCNKCAKQVNDGDMFCSGCGQPLKVQPETVRAIVREEVERELSSKYRDQKFIVVETAESIVERLEKWCKWFITVTGIPLVIGLGVLAMLGVSSYRDAVQKIDSARQKAEALSKNNRDLESTISSARQATQELAVIRSDLANSLQNLGRDISSLNGGFAAIKDQFKGIQVRVDSIEFSNVQRGFIQSLDGGDRAKVIGFLRAMGEHVKDDASKEDMIQAYRNMGLRVITSEQAQVKFFVEARKAGLIPR